MALRSIVCALALVAGATASDLYDYVWAENPDYKWFYTGHQLKENGWTGYLLNVTSGTWLSPLDSNRYLWTHQVLVVVPDVVRFYDAGALWITGGDNNNPNSVPGVWDEDTLICASLAVSTGSICSVVYQIPNQPIVFPSDPIHKSRVEDAAVAFTWKAYMLNETASPDWILYFPMTRGAIKAKQAVGEFIQTINPEIKPTRWMTMGGSKRGWITWLTGAVDSSIIGIAPCVMDLLNFEEGIQAMWQSLGNWTFAFTDYLDEGIPAYFGTEYVTRLTKIVDPINYKANLTMSKLVIDATGDEFFGIQDDHYWWGQLPGETHRLMAQNAEHSMATGALEVITAVEAWWYALLSNSPRPQFTWTMSNTTGDIVVSVTGEQKPQKVVMRYATTPKSSIPRRDFRLVAGDTPANPCLYFPINLFGKGCLRPIIWLGEDVGESAPNTYVLTQPLPGADTWRGMMAELYFDGVPGSNTTFKFTTQVSIMPNTFPFPPCYGEGCMGGLV